MSTTFDDRSPDDREVRVTTTGSPGDHRYIMYELEPEQTGATSAWITSSHVVETSEWS